MCEDALPHPRAAYKRTEGELACGEIGSRPISFRLSLRRFCFAANGREQRKPVRGDQFGGTEKDGKYVTQQGLIVGTASRGDRFFIAKLLQAAEKYDTGKEHCGGLMI